MRYEVQFKIYHNDDGLPVEVSMVKDMINPNGMRINISSSMITYQEYLAYKEAIENAIHIDSFGNKM